VRGREEVARLEQARLAAANDNLNRLLDEVREADGFAAASQARLRGRAGGRRVRPPRARTAPRGRWPAPTSATHSTAGASPRMDTAGPWCTSAWSTAARGRSTSPRTATARRGAGRWPTSTGRGGAGFYYGGYWARNYHNGWHYDDCRPVRRESRQRAYAGATKRRG